VDWLDSTHGGAKAKTDAGPTLSSRHRSWNGSELGVLNLNYPDEDDLEPGTIRNYDYMVPAKLPRRNDKTSELPPGISQFPMPYPGYGFHAKLSRRECRDLAVSWGTTRQVDSPFELAIVNSCPPLAVAAESLRRTRALCVSGYASEPRCSC
jgi:hypothetical protein